MSVEVEQAHVGTSNQWSLLPPTSYLFMAVADPSRDSSKSCDMGNTGAWHHLCMIRAKGVEQRLAMHSGVGFSSGERRGRSNHFSVLNGTLEPAGKESTVVMAGGRECGIPGSLDGLQTRDIDQLG